MYKYNTNTTCKYHLNTILIVTKKTLSHSLARQCHITAVSWLVCPNSHMFLETNTIQTLQTNTMQTQHKYKKQTKCHKTVARWQVCSNGHMLPNCAPRAIFGHKATFVSTTLIIYFAIQTNTFCYFGQMHIIF